MNNSIEYYKKNGYELNFSKVFEDSWRIFKGIFTHNALATMVYLLLSLPILYLIADYTGLLNVYLELIDAVRNGSNDVNRINKFAKELESGSEMYIFYAVSVILGSLLYPLFVGIMKCAKIYDENGKPSYNEIFSYYKGNVFLKLLLLAFIFFTIGTAMSLIPKVGFIVKMYMSTAFVFAAPLIVFNNYSTLDAISSSFALAHKNFFTILGILIVSVLAIVLAIVFTCGLGSIFLLPMPYIFAYSIYKNSIGDVERQSEINEIGIE